MGGVSVKSILIFFKLFNYSTLRYLGEHLSVPTTVKTAKIYTKVPLMQYGMLSMFKEFDDLTVNRTPNIQEAAPGKE